MSYVFTAPLLTKNRSPAAEARTLGTPTPSLAVLMAVTSPATVLLGLAGIAIS